MFEYDPARNKFYMLDVDFTKPAPKGGRPITLFAIDPVSGKTAATPVTGGPVGYVHGYVMHEESGNVHFSTAGEGVWNFWLVDPDTGKATRVGDAAGLPRSADEGDPSFYAGYHRGVDPTGTRALRLGYQSVVNQQGAGIGIAQLGSAAEAASAAWHAVAAPAGDRFYMSFQRAPGGVDKWLSLAPNASTNLLDLIEWNLASGDGVRFGASRVVASLGNAAAPRVMGGGQLGFLGDAVRATGPVGSGTYVALVDQESAIPIPFPGALDRWALATVDLATGATTHVALDPMFLVGSNSLSGLGLPRLS